MPCARISQPSGDQHPPGVVGPRYFFLQKKMDQQTQPTIALKFLDIKGNYRRRRSKESLESLAENIKEIGVFTPIVIRSAGNGMFNVIAGSRRVAASRMAHGDDWEIPYILRDDLDEAGALHLSVTENKERADTTAVEDAEAAEKLLGMLKGDRAETARRLGWSPSTLSRRLALLNATQETRDAYIDEKIELGHLEILAALPPVVQEKVLASQLATNAPVAKLKELADAALMKLDDAIFSKDDCVGCKWNSGNQAALFDVALAGSRCTNSACYSKKTEEEIENRRKALTETYQVVRIVRPGDKETMRLLRDDGPTGVGAEQAKACRMCQDFGACVSAVPRTLGKTFKEICFNPECNDEKVKANQAATEQASAKAQASKEGGQGEQKTESATEKPGKTQNASSKAAKVELRNAVKEYREKVWRLVFSRAVKRQPVEVNRSLLIALLLTRPNVIDNNAVSNTLAKELGTEALGITDVAKNLKALMALDNKALATALQNLPAHVTSLLTVDEVAKILKVMDVKLEQYWKLTASFLDVLTKTEIDAVCKEIGIEAHMGKEYSKALQSSKADLIKAVTELKDFQYVGAVPKFMHW